MAGYRGKVSNTEPSVGASSIITVPGFSPLLPGSDFITLEESKPQSNILLFGDSGTGKTTFVTEYAPEPVALINFDKRARDAVKKALKKGRRILYTEIPFPANIIRLEEKEAKVLGKETYDRVLRNFEAAVTASLSGGVRTIAIDTGTELAEILTIAFRGRPDKTASDYGKSKDMINRSLWRLFNLAREGNAHFVMLARAKAIWQNNEPTGEFTYRGPEVICDAADWAGQIRVRKSRGKAKFELKVTKAGIDVSQLGEVYDEELWGPLGGPFACACMLQHGGAPEDWQ